MKDTDYINPKIISAYNEVENMKFHLQLTAKSPYYYVHFFLNGQRKFLSTKEKTKKRANQQARILIANQILKSGQTPRDLRTINDVAELYSKGLSKNTKLYLQWWKEHLGDTCIQDVTQDKLDELCNLYAEETPNNIAQSNNRACSPIFALLKWCLKRKYTDKTYHQNKLTVTTRKSRRTITDEEFARLIRACKETTRTVQNKECDYTYLIDPLLFYMNTGFRKRELITLKREDVDRETQTVMLRTQKNKRINQRITLNNIAWQIVLRNLLKSNGEYLFSGHWKSNGRALGDFKKAFKMMRKKAGLLDIDIHCIRHTAIMKVAMSSECKSEHQLMQFSRHKSREGLEPYLHALKGDQLKETVELASWGQEYI